MEEVDIAVVDPTDSVAVDIAVAYLVVSALVVDYYPTQDSLRSLEPAVDCC